MCILSGLDGTSTKPYKVCQILVGIHILSLSGLMKQSQSTWQREIRLTAHSRNPGIPRALAWHHPTSLSSTWECRGASGSSPDLPSQTPLGLCRSLYDPFESSAGDPLSSLAYSLPSPTFFWFWLSK